MIERVPPALDGERLDRVVALLTEVSRSRVADAIAGGLVKVDGGVVTQRSRRVVEGEALEIHLVVTPTVAGVDADASIKFEVVHVDAAVIVVDKPEGLVVHPGAGHAHDTLVNGLVARFPELADVGDPDRPGIVHRLDRGTSGLMVVARTKVAYESLVQQLSERAVERTYVALVSGVPAPRGVIDAPIARSHRDPTRMAVVESGRHARTRYLLLRELDGGRYAQLSCGLESGRTHQIRVHLAAIGHPVVGDERYGPGRPTLGLGRPFLHAARLAFQHPFTGAPVTFESPLPPDLRETLAALDGGLV